MLLLVGLGNPGPNYAATRHNIGFMALDAIVARHKFEPWRAEFEGSFTHGTVEDWPIALLKPHTFMNDSGRSVAACARELALEPPSIAVIHDDLDLPPGELRVKSGGGNAGHRGLNSVSTLIGNDYRRVRIGIGRPADRAQVLDYVLGDFSPEELSWVKPLCAAIEDRIATLIAGFDVRFRDEVSEVTRISASNATPR